MVVELRMKYCGEICRKNKIKRFFLIFWQIFVAKLYQFLVEKYEGVILGMEFYTRIF